MKLHGYLANWLLGRMFLPEPELNLDDEKIAVFESVYQQILAEPETSADWVKVAYPKHEFLRYVTREKHILLHGSNLTDLQELQPRKQTDWSGKMIQAVFASGDGIWPIFFAILDSATYQGAIRNACFVVGEALESEKRYYFFSLQAGYQPRFPWCNGMVYLLPASTFEKTSQGLIRFDEWVSREAVRPVGRLEISPLDFPFLNQVAWHDKKEAMFFSWLRYKKRLGRLKADHPLGSGTRGKCEA